MGTARMSESTSAGVVDPNGRMHHVDNLYIAGSATFPTCGQANPTLTIVAMALRLAQHLEDRFDPK
jgi:choline dehydrogenase-like flavoprotein